MGALIGRSSSLQGAGLRRDVHFAPAKAASSSRRRPVSAISRKAEAAEGCVFALAQGDAKPLQFVCIERSVAWLWLVFLDTIRRVWSNDEANAFRPMSKCRPASPHTLSRRRSLHP